MLSSSRRARALFEAFLFPMIGRHLFLRLSVDRQRGDVVQFDRNKWYYR